MDENKADFRVESFALPEYWNNFFRHSGNSFEWYADSTAFFKVVKSYAKKTDQILQIGCGTSTLADILYDNGFKNVTSIDIVNDVIKKQTYRNRRRRPGLRFQCADACDTPFSSGQFGTVVDKGTVDALVPVENEQLIEKVESVFREMDRVLAVNGRYVVVSLCQSFVIKTWLAFFSERNYLLRVERMLDVGSGSGDSFYLPVFCLIATKLRLPTPSLFLELRNGDETEKFPTCESFVARLRSVQRYHAITRHVQFNRLPGEVKVEFAASKLGKMVNPLSLYVVDSLNDNQHKLKYAIFIVPPDRRKQWMFATPEGRLHLCRTCATRRLAIAYTNGRPEDFDAETFKQDLNRIAMDFAPNDMTEPTVYLSAGPDTVTGTVVEEGNSAISGKYIVRDEVDSHRTRTLRFADNLSVTQSEAFLLDGQTAAVDHDKLACGHHKVFLQMFKLNEEVEGNRRVLVVGLGGGCLPMHIRRRYPDVDIVAVEIDPVMIDVAKRWFGFKPDDRMKVVVDDGFAYLQRAAAGKETFDIILLDVAGSGIVGGLVAPLPQFVQLETFLTYRTLLRRNGWVAINFLCYDRAKMDQIKDDLIRVFPSAKSILVSDELSEIFVMGNFVDEHVTRCELARICKDFNNLRLGRP